MARRNDARGGAAAAAAPAPRPKYEFRIGLRSKADPQAAGERLDLLKARHCRRGQALPARVVLEDAQDPDSPLHDHFDWDDSSAARRFRLLQARALIVGIRVVKQGKPSEVQWVATTAVESRGGSGFLTIAEVRESADLSKQVALNALKSYRNLRERYRHIVELLGFHGRLDELFGEFGLGPDDDDE